MMAQLRAPRTPFRVTLATVLGLLLAAAPAAAQAAPAEQDVPLIQEEGDHYVLNFSEDQTGDGVNLQDFVVICEQATGRRFTYSDQTAQQLRGEKILVHGTQRIPKEDFYAYFQILMFINEFVCVEVGPPHISLVLIQGLQGGTRAGTLKQKSIYVLPQDLQDYIDQPATLITTVLTLPNIDVRQLATSLRGLLTDTNTQTLIAAGDHSVILQGFGSHIASLAQLLDIVDQASIIPEEPVPAFDVIPLQYAAAEDIADLLDQLLEARSGARGRSIPQQQGVSGALQGDSIETKILVYSTTNSILVMAQAEEMPRIKELVARLDVDVIEPERNYHIYSLQNIKAGDIADVLDEFLSDAERLTRAQQGTGGRPGGAQAAGGTSSSQNNEVVVVPDENTNSLLIAANKTRYEEVLELIRQLDRRQDQVLIETALIELTGTDFRELGVEWALADTLGDGGFGVSSFGLSTITFDEDGLPVRTPNTGDGLTAGILSGDDVSLPFLVRAAQRTDGANVLNVPSVLVNNNGSARVETKNEQPTTTITTGGVNGQTQENFRGFEEAGITLEISPSISASRYLRLDLTLVVSTFTGSFQTTSTIPPPRITRELTTTVNVPDGDTMVVGGIITDNLTETRRGIPWLSDIPLLGYLFSNDSRTNQTTTLYFFVTPHILHDRDFADLAEISYRKKLDAAEVIGRDRVRVVDPDFGVGGDKFEGFQVPLYRSPTRGEIEGNAIGLSPQRQIELLKEAQGLDDGPARDSSVPPLEPATDTDEE